jgi:hypothetical protein
MERPELKQFGDLTPEDFDRHPVWIGCHNADYGQPWYDVTDEETFRSWTGELPADVSEGMLLVRATFEFRDGSSHLGFITPAHHPGDLGTQQPQIFAGRRRFGFWGGVRGVPIDERHALYAALATKPADIFPVRFSVDPKLVSGNTTGQVSGFYRYAIRDRSVQIDF